MPSRHGGVAAQALGDRADHGDEGLRRGRQWVVGQARDGDRPFQRRIVQGNAFDAGGHLPARDLRQHGHAHARLYQADGRGQQDDVLFHARIDVRGEFMVSDCNLANRPPQRCIAGQVQDEA